MVKKNILSSILIFLLGITGCSSNKFVLNSQLANGQFYNRTLTILPISKSSIKVLALKKVKLDFGIDSSKADGFVKDILYSGLFHELLNTVNNVKPDSNIIKRWDFDPVIDSTNTIFFSEKLEGNIPIEIAIPSKPYLESIGSIADVNIILDNITISNKVVPSNMGSSESIIADYNYVIWDYNNNAAIKYGINNTIAGSSSGASAEIQWETLYNEILLDILSNTQFMPFVNSGVQIRRQD